MKRGHKRILLFEICIFLVLALNSFMPSILRGYNIVVFLIISILFFKFLFGLEKDRHRYIKDISYDLVIILIISFLIFYIAGIVIGFTRNENYYSWYGLSTFVLPIVLVIPIREFLRYQILNKAEGSKVLMVTTVIMFALMQICNSVNLGYFNSARSTFMVIALIILPAFSESIVASYLATKVGFIPNIIWLYVISLYTYLIPLLPDTGSYILSILKILYPFYIMYKINNFFKKDLDEVIERDYRKTSWWLIPSTLVLVGIVVYLNCGYFHYFVLAIGSGSMEKVIHTGDMVMVEKIAEDDDSFKVGDVIVYDYDGTMVVHRLHHTIDTDEGVYYYTKGDNNEDIDPWIVKRDMIVGVVKFKIPFMGLPVVWLNQLKK